MKKRLFMISFALLFLTACDMGPKSSLGFTLPDGDIAMGEQSFIDFRCRDCHTISERPDLSERSDGNEALMAINLGGKAPRISTYGQLVTSIINPSHRATQEYWAAQKDTDINVCLTLRLG